jgi:hypothetical protein
MPQRVSFVVSSFPSIMLEKFVHVSGACLKSERPLLSPVVPEAVCPSEITAEGLMAAVCGVVREEFCDCGKDFERGISGVYKPWLNFDFGRWLEKSDVCP